MTETGGSVSSAHNEPSVTSRRVLAWFSCGDASAVACALALKAHPEAAICRIILPNEHPDNDRFAADCARWYGREIIELQDPEKRSTWDVWEERKYIAGIAGAPCTGELKKAVRFAFQRPDELHVIVLRALGPVAITVRDADAAGWQRILLLRQECGTRIENAPAKGPPVMPPEWIQREARALGERSRDDCGRLQ